MSLEWKRAVAFEYLFSPEWEARGITHGFTGASLDFSTPTFDSARAEWCSRLEATTLYLPRQVHGKCVLDLRSEEAISRYCSGNECNFAEADGMLISLTGYPAFPGTGFGIRTADCLPVIIRDNQSLALVHAGWRGLAAGIVEEALDLMRPASALHVLLGPAAGADSYEVGSEVLEAIGSRAASKPGEKGHPLLDLAGTAANIIRSRFPDASIVSCGRNTITDRVFHSFRRDGDAAGRNLAFVIV